MIIKTDKAFNKMYKKQTEKIKRSFKKRRDLFLENTQHKLLKNHKLKGEYSGYRSINITGDIRAIYYELDDDTNVFVRIGTHSELYE